MVSLLTVIAAGLATAGPGAHLLGGSAGHSPAAAADKGGHRHDPHGSPGPTPGPTATPVPPSGTPAPSATPSPTGTPEPTPTPGPTPTPAPVRGAAVHVCGVAFCLDGHTWYMFGATIYNPGLRPEQSGLDNPAGTVAQAQEAHLNTIRITNFFSHDGDPATVPYDATSWAKVDQMIAAAGAAGLHVDLGLSDYRALLWDNCIDPYTADWSHYLTFAANRVNTVTGAVYKNDPTIAMISIAGEPLAANKPHTGVSSGGSPDPALANCTIEYSTAQLTAFYVNTTSTWKAQGGSVLVSPGGLGYINEYQSAGIDWQTIFSLSTVDICAIKTYGGMFAFAPTPAAYCHSINKPIIDEEFGYQQSTGDAQRAALFAAQYAQLRQIGAAGVAFWNLGYQVASTSYEVSPLTPLTFAAVQAAALP